MQWFRLYQEFATDPKVQMMSETNQRRLVMLFCFRCNSDVTLQDEEITFQLRITPEEWASTKAEFMKRGFVDNDNEVLNWDKRQYVSDSSNQRVKRHREKMKQDCNVTVTTPDTDTDTEQNRTDSLEHASKNEAETIPKIKPEKGKRLSIFLIASYQTEDIPQQWGDWAHSELRLSVEDINWEWEKFRDYWLSQTGQRGVKLDWLATWRNWMRKKYEDKARKEKLNELYTQKRSKYQT